MIGLIVNGHYCIETKTGGAFVHMEKPSRKPDFPQKVDDDHHDDVKLTPGRLASERSVAKRGTAVNCVQNGNEGSPADESNLRASVRATVPYH